ncbi:AAA family ATPase [Paracoccus cavernae]|uniref:AAA family ATPase n=1 Tax=Paracoccus cavernae TaxID=1571207 RepID=UPI00363E5789
MGASYESEKLKKRFDFVLIDTPPKIDSDLRPALRVADLVMVPVAISHVDLWATEGVLDLARREKAEAMIVLNRTRPNTRLAAEIAGKASEMGAGWHRSRSRTVSPMPRLWGWAWPQAKAAATLPPKPKSRHWSPNFCPIGIEEIREIS